MATIQIEVPDGKRAEWVDGVLTLVDDTPKDITERIKTFEDALEWCRENGKEHLTKPYDNYDEFDDVFAYIQLRIITCALNEGWEPKFENGEERFYPMYNTTDNTISQFIEKTLYHIRSVLHSRHLSLLITQPSSSRTSTWTSATKERNKVWK